mmetsp:Transcript_25234/g.77795  ORF Transcript_25234/g.77795 Transcript_25234/m.77795 type:complete len:532 (-) Transcript_25234:445-2040(-)
MARRSPLRAGSFSTDGGLDDDEDDACGLREGWHHSRFQPYLKVLAKDLAPEAVRLGTASPRCCAEINVGHLLSNARACAAEAEKGGCRCMAVVKADAYGHGAAVVARSLHTHCGIDFFAVATLPEALELRAAGLVEPVRVLVLGASVPSEWPVYARFGLELVVESSRTAMRLGCLPESAGPLRVHVMLNTGMNRIGLQTFDSTTETHGRKAESPRRATLRLDDVFKHLGPVPEDGADYPPPPPVMTRSDSLGSLGSAGRQQEYHGVQIDGAVEVIAALAAAPAVTLAGLCTHMADATANIHRYTQRQFGRFRDVVVALSKRGVDVPCVHVENSQTLLDAHVGPERMRQLLDATGGAATGYCRVGGALYGQRHHACLKPVLSLRAQVRHVARLEKGMTVGARPALTCPRRRKAAAFAATSRRRGASGPPTRRRAQATTGRGSRNGIASSRLCPWASPTGSRGRSRTRAPSASAATSSKWRARSAWTCSWSTSASSARAAPATFAWATTRCSGAKAARRSRTRRTSWAPRSRI